MMTFTVDGTHLMQNFFCEKQFVMKYIHSLS